jgi:hypothetical protein
MLDLNGDGINTRAAADGVMFDVNGTGTAHKVGWAAGGDALLVRDRNGDGVINDGSELYGAGTRNAEGQRMGNGFAALALEDSNGDGKVNAQDANFSELKLWVDANGDGKTDSGELHGLIDFGIVELNLDFSRGTETDNGNLLGLVGSYSKEDGSQHQMVDVWFAKDRGTAPQLADLLSDAPGQQLPGAETSVAASTTASAAPAALHFKRSLDEELMRGEVPLI